MLTVSRISVVIAAVLASSSRFIHQLFICVAVLPKDPGQRYIFTALYAVTNLW